MKKPTNDALAGIYQTNARQVARWRKDGAPLLDLGAMLLWFASRKNAPAHLVRLTEGAQASMQVQLDSFGDEKIAATTKVRNSADPDFLKSLPRGAEHALRRVQEEEATLAAEMKAQTDPLMKAVVAKQWRDTLIPLKHFENLVEADRRDSGETITRAQISPVCTALVVWLCRANEDFLNSICLQLAELENPESVLAVVAATIRQSVKNAVDAATGDGKLPGWVQQALISGL